MPVENELRSARRGAIRGIVCLDPAATAPGSMDPADDQGFAESVNTPWPARWLPWADARPARMPFAVPARPCVRVPERPCSEAEMAAAARLFR